MTLVGLVADTHDNLPLVERAVALFRERRPDLVLHLGDVASAPVVPLFAGLPVVWLRGNNDVDPALGPALEANGFAPMADEWQGEITGLRAAATHGHRRHLLQQHLGRADLLFHGHTHRRRAERLGRTLVVNPGALFRAATRTVALLHLPEGRLEWFEVTEQGIAPTGGPQPGPASGSPAP